MANIQRRVGKDGRVTWRVRVRVTGRPIQTESFARKTDATGWAIKTEAALRDGKLLPGREAKRRTVSDLIARYRLDVIPSYNPREQDQRLGKLAWWETQLGTILVTDLTTARVIECRAMLARGEGPSGEPASAATQVRYLAVLKHLFSKARSEWEWVTDNPVARARGPKEPRGRVRFLSDEERERLLAACKTSGNRRLYPLVLLALSTGARLPVLLALRWSDIDFARSRATIQESKNGEKRALSMRGSALAVLREMRQVRQIGNDLIFTTPAGHATFPRKAWEEALREADVNSFRFHDLRHSAASYLAMSGATLAEIAEVLGHKTLAMVKRYAHLSESHDSDVVERMTEKFSL